MKPFLGVLTHWNSFCKLELNKFYVTVANQFTVQLKKTCWVFVINLSIDSYTYICHLINLKLLMQQHHMCMLNKEFASLPSIFLRNSKKSNITLVNYCRPMTFIVNNKEKCFWILHFIDDNCLFCYSSQPLPEAS